MAEPRPVPGAAELLLLDPDGGFRDRLAADRAALAAAGSRRRRGGLTIIAHRLAGAAGTFGYPEISDAALALEDATIGAAEGEAVAVALARLLAALDAALAE
jgi:HPt (histidine-containing phosphotransfer) domain-containing protein